MNSEIISLTIGTDRPYFNFTKAILSYLKAGLFTSIALTILWNRFPKVFTLELVLSLIVLIFILILGSFALLMYSFRKNVKLIKIVTGKSKMENFEIVLDIRRNLNWGILEQEAGFIKFYNNTTAIHGGEIVTIFQNDSIYFYGFTFPNLFNLNNYREMVYLEFENEVEKRLERKTSS